MKQDIENIIKKNLPEKVDDDGFAQDPSVAFNNGFDEALSQINPSKIADEVLKVVGGKIEKMIKIVNYQLGGFFIEEESYNEAIKDILYLIKNN